MRGRSGFSLVELSSVLVIITLLAALLFPVFAQARSKARQATCLSNLKQLGIAHLMYWQDYDDTTVTSWSYGFSGEFSYYVQPYLRNYGVLLCPSYAASAEDYGRACNANYLPGGTDNPAGEPKMWGYGYNTGHQWANDTGLTMNAPFKLTGDYPVRIGGQVYNALYRNVPLLGVRVTAIAAPSRMILLGDSSDTVVLGLGRSYLHLHEEDDDACDRLRKFNWPRHAGGNNLVYADGHARWYRYNTTVLADGDPAVMPDVCEYFRDYDGANDPGNCKNGLSPR